jgi:tetratricopeptide (TPR) repeat protein
LPAAKNEICRENRYDENINFRIYPNIMKKIAILIFSTFVLIGCTNATRQTANTNASAKPSDNSPIVSGHSQPGSSSAAPQTSASVVPKSETKTKWTQSGTPIDTTEFDAEIAKTEKDFKEKPKDEKSKKFLAEAYLKRAVALTEARQYASAIGDYRRVLKYDPNNEDAKKWIDEIIKIYAMINREHPKEGEEPPALPFKKEV